MALPRIIPALAFTLSAAAAAQAAPGGDLGTVDFPNSCAGTAQPALQRAAALLHSFWWERAEGAFREVQQEDPSCTIAAWGIATVRMGNPFGAGPGAADAEAARAALRQGDETPAKTERERDYVKAIAAYYDGFSAKPHGARLRALSDAFEALAIKYRNDDETQIFSGLYLAATQAPSEKSLSRAKRAVLILNEQFAKHPNHPGVAHYLIHANDFPAIADQGLYAASCYAGIAPAAPHALHMPSHIFTRVGLWQQSAETNRKSRDAAKLAGNIGEQLHAYDYWAYADLQLARDSEAREIIGLSGQLTEPGRASDYARAAIQARFAVERGQWKEAAELPGPDDSNYPYTSAIRFFARGLGAARTGQPDAAEQDLTRLHGAGKTMAAAGDGYWATEIEVQELALQAWIAHARGNRDEAHRLMRAAADKEDLSEKSAVSPGRLVPARELLGDMLLEDGQAPEALAAYEMSQKRDPKRFRGFWGAGQAAEAAGDRDRARTYYAQLVDMAGAGEPRAELAAARGWLARH
jgi:hypothetical protein